MALMKAKAMMLVAQHGATMTWQEEGHHERGAVRCLVVGGVQMMGEQTSLEVAPIRQDRCLMTWTVDVLDWSFPLTQVVAEEGIGPPRLQPCPLVQQRKIQGSLGFQC